MKQMLTFHKSNMLRTQSLINMSLNVILTRLAALLWRFASFHLLSALNDRIYAKIFLLLYTLIVH